MTHRTYIPKRGDLVHMNFSPSAGHEMADRHYALVVSATEYNRKSRMCIVCAITSAIHGWPFEVRLKAGILPPKQGQAIDSVVVADSVRQIDFRERETAFVATAPVAVLNEVMDKLLLALEGI